MADPGALAQPVLRKKKKWAFGRGVLIFWELSPFTYGFGLWWKGKGRDLWIFAILTRNRYVSGYVVSPSPQFSPENNNVFRTTVALKTNATNQMPENGRRPSLQSFVFVSFVYVTMLAFPNETNGAFFRIVGEIDFYNILIRERMDWVFADGPSA